MVGWDLDAGRTYVSFGSDGGACLDVSAALSRLTVSLPKSEALPSVVFFAECLLSGTR
jgi:hypothetical protein